MDKTCRHCLSSYSTKNKLNLHQAFCFKHALCNTTSREKKTFEFEKFYCKLPLPVTSYADFEGNIKPMNKTKANTKILYERKTILYGLATISELEYLSKSKYIADFGKPCVKSFVKL